jgi:hypothetical protein
MPLQYRDYAYIDRSDTSMEDFGSVHNKEGSGHFDLNCLIAGHSNGMSIEMNYNNRTHTADRVEKMMGKFAAVLEYIAASPEETLSNILTCD